MKPTTVQRRILKQMGEGRTLIVQHDILYWDDVAEDGIHEWTKAASPQTLLVMMRNKLIRIPGPPIKGYHETYLVQFGKAYEA